MTSASELFHSRRHRLGRYNNNHLALDSEHVPHLHHPRRHSRPPSSSSERAAVDRFERRYRRSLLNTESARGVGAPPRLNPSDRLPVGVLLARARLVERLRGDPLSPNRQYERDSNSIIRDHESDFISELTSQMGRSHLLQEKPPGLTQEALDCLHVQVFSSRDAAQDCSICLESFMDGDELICLSCHHKFHSACLDPWVRSCGDCPYCRRRIPVNNNQQRVSSEY